MFSFYDARWSAEPKIDCENKQLKQTKQDNAVVGGSSGSSILNTFPVESSL